MCSLDISLRDGGDTVSNLGMAEDAYNGKNILIVDDINDQGSTIAWIKQDWPSGCHPNHPAWNKIWGHTVRFATLTNNLASKESVDYTVWEVNKVDENCWLVYPWEEFWL
jgi:hypoxanthine phosphoribosyltransferase